MYCMHCGASNSDAAKFCRSCGRSLAEEVRPPVPAEEETVVLEETSGERAGSREEPSQGSTRQGRPYENGGYGSQEAYGSGAYEGQPPYGGQFPYGSGGPDGNQPSYGGQPYGNPPYGNQQPYGNPSSYEGGQPFEGRQPYGYGQPGYGHDYGYPPSYGAVNGKKQKKKGKKGVVIAVVLLLLAAAAGVGAFLFIRENDPMAPVDQFFNGLKNGKWEKVYDSVYWGDSDSAGWMSKDEFIGEIRDEAGDFLSMSGVLDSLKVRKVSEGESYEGDDGLARKRLTIEMSISFMGMNESQEMDMVVVKEGKKFLIIPVWKIDNESMEELF